MEKQLIVMAGFIALDIVTGLLKALSNKECRSINMREGLIHKLTELFAAAFGIAIDFALPILGISVRFSVFSAMVVYITMMEAGSIIENIGAIYPALGTKLSTVFKDASGHKDDDDGSV